MHLNTHLPFCGVSVQNPVIFIFIDRAFVCQSVFELQLIQSPALAPLGLMMLKTTSEELACPREDLSVARKDELRKLLLEQVPTVLGLLTGENNILILCNLISECK